MNINKIAAANQNFGVLLTGDRGALADTLRYERNIASSKDRKLIMDCYNIIKKG